MKKYALVVGLTGLLTLPLVSHAQTAPTPCQSTWPKVYLIVDNTRRHIADWDTFLNLGYLTADIVPCGNAVNDPEGAPITNLLKGSSVEVYLVKDAIRHHIPNMDTFNALGFHSADITVLPDDFIAWWPVGKPLASALPADSVYQEFPVGDYTIRLWRPAQGMNDFATLSIANQTVIRVDDIESVGQLPATDVTGDGVPEFMFLTHPNGSAHCCYGTVIYSLGAAPTPILNIVSPAYQMPGTGRGDFEDIDGDGRDEFITLDPLADIPCTQPSVYTILRYDLAQGKYVGATPHFASYRADMIARYLSLPPTSDPCTIYPMVTTLSYFGKTDEAKAAYDRLYLADNAAAYWDTLQSAVHQGRFFVAPNE